MSVRDKKAAYNFHLLSVQLKVMMSPCERSIGTLALALAFPSGWLPSPLGELEGAAIEDCLKRMWGLTEVLLWI